MYILNSSKVLMYEFLYDYIKNKYGNKSILIFTDTDSLIYEMKTQDVYKGFSKRKKCLTLLIIGLTPKYDIRPPAVARRVLSNNVCLSVHPSVFLPVQAFSWNYLIFF